nr:HipA domain-containing protein [Pelodictyon luteolum]
MTPPILPYDETELEALALTVVRNHVTIPGVQPKLSLHLDRPEKRLKPQRFTIVGLWGKYILKPPSPSYPQLPEIEDLTMHMAETVKIRTVPHCLIRMRSGALAYITRRIDRPKNGKVHMEDMCQLTERLTEDKYHGSYEQIAKAIRRYSLNPGLDVIDFYEMVAFSFLTGNSDMHLKNFSLLDVGGMGGTGYSLAPAYDMLATGLVNPADTEELALTLNGKKSRLRLQDFQRAWSTSQVDTKVQERMLKKFQNAMPAWEQLIANSFLGQGMKAAYLELIHAKFSQLGL